MASTPLADVADLRGTESPRPTGKNILIFSDGTGQAGGIRPDQRLSNIYKLFRATRIGPDSPIDPARQIAFYDPGLGTDSDVGPMPLRLVRLARKIASSATGAGISRNVIDCYAAILKHYEPGDRLYLFGFSRGAYTVRCVAGVLNLCGVPTRHGEQSGCPRFGSELRSIAREAVRDVYEHGAGRDRAELEDQREELGRRFRLKYRSDVDGHANVAPYFIGVFDTVAALGARGWSRAAMILALALMVALPLAGLALIGARLSGLPWPQLFLLLGTSAGLGATIRSVLSRIKFVRDYPAPFWKRWHVSGWRLGYYDRFLDKRVRFARHALAIDERRAAFARVPWGMKKEVDMPKAGEPPHLVQMWFAGNHSDIGGSYPEEESRLSDITLEWMVGEATRIPDPILIDRSRLNLFPSAAGMQHCEVTSLRDKYPRWARKWLPGWKEKIRTEVLGAMLHASVYERFALSAVQQCDQLEPYRPTALRAHPKLAARYQSIP